MDPVIIKKGKKISLAVLTRDDAPILYRIINDQEVHRMLSSPGKIYSLVEEYEWIDNRANVYGENVNFSIKLNENNETIGVIGINPIDRDGRGHVGYYLQREHWNRGFMKEALSLMIDFAFTTLNLRKLYTQVYAVNPASSRVLESNGFRKCATMERDHYVPGHGYVDSYMYELLNPNNS